MFLQWKPGQFRVVVGTYTIGFAERLPLDNTRRVTPRGIYLVDDYRRVIDLSSTCKLSGAGIIAGESLTGAGDAIRMVLQGAAK